MDIEVRPLRRNEVKPGGRVIAGSLLVEPGFTAIIPDPGKRLKVMTPLMTGTLSHAVRLGTAYGAILDGKVLGVAIWLPPGAFPFNMMANLRLLPSLRGMRHIGLAKARELATVEENAKAHFPGEPVWYLQAFGVSPETQGQGIGSRLLQPVLDQADASGKACYLETGTERNVRFYERFGFEVRESDVNLVSEGPTHWTMIRQPQLVIRG